MSCSTNASRSSSHAAVAANFSSLSRSSPVSAANVNSRGPEVDGQLLKPAQQGAVVRDRLAGEGQLREAFEQRLQADLQFHARERRAEAGMDATAEGDVVARVGTGRVE